MGFKFITSDEKSIIYAIGDDGVLRYFQDKSRNGSSWWANDGVGQSRGPGWESYRFFFGGRVSSSYPEYNVYYGITPNGELLYYRDYSLFPSLGEIYYDGVIGSGWGEFRHVFSDGNGRIYAVAQNGDLLYYRDEISNGEHHWAYGGVGQRIGTGWGNFKHVFPGGDGIIYAVAQNGDLLYYRDLARDGTSNWAYNGEGQIIMTAQGTGNHFNEFQHVFYGGDGIIYAIENNGNILYFRDLARDGTYHWENDAIAKKIGTVSSDGSRIHECVGIQCEREFDLFSNQRQLNSYYPLNQYVPEIFYYPVNSYYPSNLYNSVGQYPYFLMQYSDICRWVKICDPPGSPNCRWVCRIEVV
ncbi:tachylectin-related carbohydrate-binding protein [Peribacillus simplex]